ncbi:MAG: BspA family leucine-rich repeat surface protein [Flavobacteriaceae bacterium]|nr:BspA family leucine-rich repeat surface protein [Flavobacteriaceae bacterium]
MVRDVGDWDVSRVTAMLRIFEDASSFNQDLSGWDVDQVTNCHLATCVLSASRRPRFSNCNDSCP